MSGDFMVEDLVQVAGDDREANARALAISLALQYAPDRSAMQQVTTVADKIARYILTGSVDPAAAPAGGTENDPMPF